MILVCILMIFYMNKTLISNDDINKYVTDLLLSLLGYYKKRYNK